MVGMMYDVPILTGKLISLLCHDWCLPGKGGISTGPSMTLCHRRQWCPCWSVPTPTSGHCLPLPEHRRCSAQPGAPHNNMSTADKTQRYTLNCTYQSGTRVLYYSFAILYLDAHLMLKSLRIIFINLGVDTYKLSVK